jgi:SAM-dependent methyltransferase
LTTLLEEIAEFFADRLQRFGATPAGVDYRDAQAQEVRFRELCKVISEPSGSVLDFGCGYAGLLDFLRQQGFTGAYHGVDVSVEMISAAAARHAGDTRASFEVGSTSSVKADYVIASAIFNIRYKRSTAEWRTFVETTLEEINRVAIAGFSFNCLTSYSDPERMRQDLYYGDPCYYFDLCKRRYSRQVALLHDYGLYDFTIIVRKS